MATDKNYNYSWIPAVLGSWRKIANTESGYECAWCFRETDDPISGHDGFCPCPALHFLNNERLLTPRALDLPSAAVNHCVPVNGVHAPFCTGHESASQ